MLKRRVEEIKRHNTLKEYRKHFKYTKNLTKEYEPRNLNVLDVNGRLLSENKGYIKLPKKITDWNPMGIRTEGPPRNRNRS
jgi:hypothetical protein